MGPEGIVDMRGVVGMKRILAAVVMVIALTAMAAPPCWACSCAPSTKKDEAKSSDVIFYGKVTDIKEVAEFKLRVKFNVRRVYKGFTSETTSVFTSTDGASCGVYFEEGRRYTVFADKYKDGEKWTSSCSGTKQGRINPDNYGLGNGWSPGD